jgi:hypothetical protein
VLLARYLERLRVIVGRACLRQHGAGGLAAEGCRLIEELGERLPAERTGRGVLSGRAAGTP